MHRSFSSTQAVHARIDRKGGEGGGAQEKWEKAGVSHSDLVSTLGLGVTELTTEMSGGPQKNMVSFS